MPGAQSQRCEVCGEEALGIEALADHLVERAGVSDAAHVMWLNRNVSKHRVDPARLAILLRDRAAGRASDEDRVAR